MSSLYLADSLSNILSIARLAPSVHNTQPWSVKVTGESLVISIQRNRRLSFGDPTGRQTYISLGIFAEACVVGLSSCGFKVLDLTLKDDKVVIKTKRASQKSEQSMDASLLKRRWTDRSVYKPNPISKSAGTEINGTWQTNAVNVLTTDDKTITERCAQLTKQALLLALSNPGFRKELADYIVTSPKIPYGIPFSTLGINKLKTLAVKKLLTSGLSRKKEAQLEYVRWKSASGLVFILAEGDSPTYWVESGRAYLRASLKIEQLGLSQATSAAVVEASDFHEDMEILLGTKKRIQCVIRIGSGKKTKKTSGRYSVKELLST